MAEVRGSFQTGRFKTTHLGLNKETSFYIYVPISIVSLTDFKKKGKKTTTMKCGGREKKGGEDTIHTTLKC